MKKSRNEGRKEEEGEGEDRKRESNRERGRRRAPEQKSKTAHVSERAGEREREGGGESKSHQIESEAIGGTHHRSRQARSPLEQEVPSLTTNPWATPTKWLSLPARGPCA